MYVFLAKEILNGRKRFPVSARMKSASQCQYHAAALPQLSIDIMKVNCPTTLRQLIVTILVGLQATIVRLVPEVKEKP